MEFEEASIYPLTVELLDEESAEEAEIEAPASPRRAGQTLRAGLGTGFGAAVAMVQAGIQHHVEEEEGEMFPELRQQVDDARQSDLVRQLVAAKQQAGLLATSLERASKDDLLTLADGLGLEAKSSMTKDELSRLVESAAA